MRNLGTLNLVCNHHNLCSLNAQRRIISFLVCHAPAIVFVCNLCVTFTVYYTYNNKRVEVVARAHGIRRAHIK